MPTNLWPESTPLQELRAIAEALPSLATISLLETADAANASDGALELAARLEAAGLGVGAVFGQFGVEHLYGRVAA